MLAFRLLRVLIHLFRGLATCALLFPLIDDAGRRAHVRAWSVRLVALCGVRVRIEHLQDAQPAPRALMVSNHVSWLDIFVINSLHPTRFVAKSDIRSWPLIGWLCEKTGTIFIARGKLRDVRRIYQGLVTSLHAGEHVAFFPEGTTAPQGTLLPFHANLFEAAIEADVPVQPYAVRYLDANGRLHPAADFVGEMTFVQSMMTILKAGGVTAELTVLPIIDTGESSHRRELADAAYDAIRSSLGVDTAGNPPG
ncbi:lysophospholipid acyltransferase family protein [Noviherbaspirillum denitrificans]|uniref:Acyl-phosphate glycerol 3-phosphate acyltransferase n=1 Tax=Noviherbaspirillum denitrificans TaxID=1968433 RepID=A0A254TCS2_9BURK|nr:lysophospholipid acyltransferase family protein [Noviherbaspirillum denitrificans]OWW19967.1 acyl-phosphate glycerol 3-phosphate acyltransferase [Noviherbaspirillum denitrificans]